MPKNQDGTHRLRQGRYSQTNFVYLITMVCFQRRPVFDSLRKGRCCVKAIRQVSDLASTLCFVVMPDHVHWLMQLGLDANMSQTVQKVKSLTTKRLRELDRDHGPVWQKGFHDRAIRFEENVKDAARYVIANPLRAGLVDSVGDYALWDACWL